MKIKLLKDVLEHDRHDKPVGLKVTMRGSRPTVAWVKGAIIEVSEESGRKFIERRQAELHEERDANESQTDTGEGAGTPTAETEDAGDGAVPESGPAGATEDASGGDVPGRASRNKGR